VVQGTVRQAKAEYSPTYTTAKEKQRNEDITVYLAGKKSSRSGNESFLTYFRFLSSHTTVRAVRHTAV